MTRGTGNQSQTEYDKHNEVGMHVVLSTFSKPERVSKRIVFGLILFISGGLVFSAQLFHQERISFLAPICIGAVFLATFFRSRLRSYLISGSIVSGLGLGIYLAELGIPDNSFVVRLGVVLVGLACGFLGISLLVYWAERKFNWWALIAAAPVGAVGFTLAFTSYGFFDFVLYVATAVGMTLLIVGVNKKMIGFIIPGCLLVGIGPGVVLAWHVWVDLNPLAQTGVMLVWFALGWVLITVFSRIAIEKFVWWPLIPGGIIGMVGWGLYIGGNPGNAVNFIGNTGSIAMIIFGLYLLLMRRGIRH